MVKVVVHPADKGGCGYYRLIWPGEACRDAGHDVTVDFDFSYQARWQPSAFGPDRIIGLAEDVEADVVVLQRPLTRTRYELIGALQDQGVKVVVECDDDFHSVHKRNLAWSSTNPLKDPEHNRDWLMRSCERADLVTVSTPALAERYGHGKVRVLPNYVPERYLACDGSSDEVTVGWSGSVATHPGDLEVTSGAVARALVGARMGVVGTGVGVKDRLRLDHEPVAAGWVPIEDYPHALARFDVGIVPLLSSPFNEAKSWLKGLEFAAVGVPYVSSSTGEYRELAKLTGAPIATNPAEWFGHVSALVRDEILRKERAEQARDAVKDLTVEANAWRWIEAWSEA